MTRSDKSPSFRRLAIVAAVTAFLAADVALVAYALSQSRVPPETSATYLVPTPPPSVPLPSSTASATPVPQVTVRPVLPDESIAPLRLLAALDSSTAWRVPAAGECPATTVGPQLTTDGGKSWETFDASRTTAASAALQLDTTSEVDVGILTQNSAGCSFQYTVSDDAGATWTAVSDSRLASQWFVHPTDSYLVQSPRGSLPAPCSAIAITSLSADDALLLCREQIVFRTIDGGVTWDGGLAIPGSAAVDNTDEGYIVAAIDQVNCNGVEVRYVERTSQAEDGRFAGCFETNTSPGLTAIAYGAGSVWVWSESQLGISEDGGATWR